MCWISFVAASGKSTVMAYSPPLKQTNTSEDLCVEKRLQISRFVSNLVFPSPPSNQMSDN